MNLTFSIFLNCPFFGGANVWNLVHADSIWSCRWAVCLISPRCSDLSYFLGELEKCVAEPERLAQLFIKHVSLSIILVFIFLSVPSKTEQNFLSLWVNRAEVFNTCTHFNTSFILPSSHSISVSPVTDTAHLRLCICLCVHWQGKKRREKRYNKHGYVLW